MRKIPRPLRSIFRPLVPRSSAIEQGLAVTSILAAMVLAAMALVVHHINQESVESSRRSVRAIETMATLDRLQIALRDGDMAARDLAVSHNRPDAVRYDNSRFQARLHLTALGPLAGDEPAQAERLSRLTPLVEHQLALALATRGAGDPATVGERERIDTMITTLQGVEGRQLEGYRARQGQASDSATWIMIGSLCLVSLLSIVFWALLKIEFRARRALESRLIASATTDELTGVSNRSDFDLKLVQEWSFRERYATALSLMIVDIDQLKQHNESWGHLAGDTILREIARRLAAPMKRSDLLSRIGGGQFAILVPHYRKEALGLAEHLRALVADAPCVVQKDGRPDPVRVTVSIGVAEASDVDSPRGLLAAAEVAVDAAKEKGRNRVEAFHHDTTIGGFRGATTGGAPASAAREQAPVTVV